MSKSLILSKHRKLVWLCSGFSCVLSFFKKLIEVFAEGQILTQIEKKRYPFADW